MVSGDWLKLKDIGEMGEWEKREAGKIGSQEVGKLRNACGTVCLF